MKKLILMVFLCLNVFGTEKIEINRNIVKLEIDERSFIFDIKDVVILSKYEVMYYIRFKGNDFSIKYSEPETYSKLAELFKSYNIKQREIK